jgi:hypothetical protein
LAAIHQPGCYVAAKPGARQGEPLPLTTWADIWQQLGSRQGQLGPAGRGPRARSPRDPAYRQCQPPSTIRSTPLTAVFSSRNTTALTISSMRQRRWIGVSEVYLAIAAGFSDQ